MNEFTRSWFLICVWWISICLFCFSVSRFIACDHPISGYNQLVCFKDWFFWPFLFLSLARIKQCLPPSISKYSTHHRDFLCQRASSQFCFCGPYWWSRKTQNPFEVCKICSAIQQIWQKNHIYLSSWEFFTLYNHSMYSAANNVIGRIDKTKVWEWEFLTVCVFIKKYCSFTDWL